MIFDRIDLLLGSDFLERARNTKIIIFGVGGVGSWCAESLVRTGFADITLVDDDIVSDTNVNRQLMATTSTIGKPKVEVMQQRLLDINPQANIKIRQERYTPSKAESFHLETYDYIIDCIDSLKDKLHLILHANSKLTKTQVPGSKFQVSGSLPLTPPSREGDSALSLQHSSYSCYIKISEGCDRHCAYCAIPLITGKHKSRPIDEILDEVRERVGEGVKEFNIIAQELTYYGVDIDGKRHIAELTEKMAEIPGVHWIRLHYAYPNQFPMELLKVMREKDNVCKYLDIALQHISTRVLDNMRRNTTKEETMELITKLREEVPGICLRTTLMVGYPGETEEDFQELVDFVRWARFDRMGAFAYSEEDGTYSAEHFEDNVPSEVKQKRLDKLMRVQQRISHEIMDQNIGKTMEVVIDREEGDYYIARSQYSSPEVDPEILIRRDEAQLNIGEFYNVEITESEDFDLYATIKH